jgi:hypothetical protein
MGKQDHAVAEVIDWGFLVAETDVFSCIYLRLFVCLCLLGH